MTDYDQVTNKKVLKDALFVISFFIKMGITWWLVTRFPEADLQEVKKALAILLASWWMLLWGLKPERGK